MESKKFVVDDGGNRRTGITKDDIKQAVNDIVQWFKTNAPACSTEGKKGRAESDIVDFLSSVGAAEGSLGLLVLLGVCDGGF